MGKGILLYIISPATMAITKTKTKRIVPRNRNLSTYIDKRGRIAVMNLEEYVDVCPGTTIGAVMIKAEEDDTSSIPRITVQLDSDDTIIQFVPCIRLCTHSGIYVKEWRSLENIRDPQATEYYFSFDRDFLNEF